MSLDPLFREDCIREQRHSLMGEPLRARVPGWRSVMLALAICVVLIVGFCTLVHYNQKVRLSGVLAPKGGLITLPAPEQGTVQRIERRQGDEIKTGDLLVELAPQSLDPQAQRETDRQRAALRAELADVERTAAVEHQNFDQRVRYLHDRGDSLSEDLRSLRQELDLLRQRNALETAQLPQLAELSAKGLVARRTLQEAQAKALEFQSTEQRLQRQQRQFERDLDDLARQRDALSVERQVAVTSAARRLRELEEFLATLEQRQRRAIHAPADGVVATLLVEEGHSIEAGQSVLTMARSDQPLECILLMPATASGQVGVGDPVVLRLPAFPYQRFGHINGVVREISAATLNASQLRAAGLSETQPLPMFRVMVSLQQQSVAEGEVLHSFKAGMQVDADIVLQRRRMIDWMLEPLRAAQMRAQAG